MDHLAQLTLQRMDQSKQDFSKCKQQYYDYQKQTEKVTTQPVSIPATIKTNNDVEPPTPPSMSTTSRQPDDGDTIAGNMTFSDRSTITTSLFDGRYGRDRLAKYAVLSQA